MQSNQSLSNNYPAYNLVQLSVQQEKKNSPTKHHQHSIQSLTSIIMKLTSAISWSLIAYTAFGASDAAAPGPSSNYPVIRNVDEPKTGLSYKDEQLCLDGFFNWVEYDEEYIDENLIPLFNQHLEYIWSPRQKPGLPEITFKPKLFVNILGGELNTEPSFETKSSQSYADFWFKTTLKYGRQLTDVMNFMGIEHGVDDHFKYFGEQRNRIWQNHQDNLKQQIINYSPTNDGMFSYELASLVHLRDFARDVRLHNDAKFIIQMSSFASIKNKIGANSTTYKHAVGSLENILESLNVYFDILVVESPNYTPKDRLQKKSQVRSAASAPAFGYASKQACEVATDKCSAHGECKENKDQWSCVCEPSFNKTTSKTTTWVGYDCGKKDVSVPANLFLWTTIALVLSLVGGIKLLASVGSDPLPGVLDAATLPTKKTI
ncbi:membrane-localized protein [Candida orthopsilosis Co 90-125]|uniref:Membrane-localized protein n=1 Tax=Candida orthopsilosis (strain 90-125) TaxID=1136231 RepID=H8XAV4_CANO9|nr:membrane-localized protein [Candida orthopsilosis Co 90-125]CCG24955.1 membrane-localized protein [Candida orthopsilosis Co 90-125]